MRMVAAPLEAAAMPAPQHLLACAIGAFAASWMIVVMCRLAGTCGMVDRPGGRKRHVGDVPLIGGIAIWFGVMAAVPALDAPTRFDVALLATGTLLAFAGALDDRFGLSARVRLVIEVGSVLAVVACGGPHIVSFGRMLDMDFSVGVLGVPLTAVAIVGLLNAFNMMDGIDGLAGGLALVAIASLIGYTGGQGAGMPLLLVLAAAIVPYLAVNLGLLGQRIFLGDAGTMFIGYVLGWSLIVAAQGTPPRGVSLIGVTWCVALPVFDTTAVVWRRVRAGRSPFAPDRCHIHHLLVDAGVPARVTLALLLALATGLAVIGHFMRQLAPGSNLLALTAALLIHVAATGLGWRIVNARATSSAARASGVVPASVD
jgi:UDP-GlcNAc:undecaprenyl-phosphate/decaprenyl-phosphate GlcNAc-1-phosphate transferase